MDSVAHVNVPLRAGKKMKKRKELDALVANTINKRCAEVKRSSSAGGVSSHDGLLSDSTDDQDYWTSSAPGKSLRCHRRRYLVRKRTCSAFLRACSAILVFTCVIATTTVMWLFIDVREQVTSLRTELNQVVAGNDGVPEALQQCHSLSKELQKNQSRIVDRLLEFTALHNNFTVELTEVKNVLRTVQDQLKSSPDLVNVPQSVETLSKQVATFGSKIADLGSTVSTIKDQYGEVDAAVKNLVTNVTEMKVKLTNVSNANNEKSSFTDKEFAQEKEDILSRIKQVSANLSTVNDTLSNKLSWTAGDQSRDHKLIESLQEMNENVTARVKTLEGLCAKDSEPPKSDFKGNPTPVTISSPSPTSSQFSSNNNNLDSKKSENPP